MSGVSFAAWQNGRYVGLAEILLVLGRAVIGLIWRLQIAEVAPEPGSAGLNQATDAEGLSTLDVLHLVAPDVQIIDGEVQGFRGDDSSPVLVIRAVDSTSWDVVAADTEILAVIRAAYPDAADLPKDQP